MFGNDSTVAVATYDGKPEIFTVEDVVVVAGELTIGIKCVNAEANWVGFDNVRLAYTGALPESVLLPLRKEVFTAMAMEFAPAVESFQLYMIAQNELYPVLESVQGLFENLDNATLAEVDEAIAAMEAATVLMDEANEIYAEYMVFVNLFKDASEMSEPATTEAAELLEYNMYGSGGMMATSVSDLAQKAEWIKEDYLAYIANAYALNGAMFDVTFLVADAAVTSAENWTGGNVNHGEKYTGAPDEKYLDWCNWSGAPATFDMHQEIVGLPAGEYALTAATRSHADMDGAIYIQQGEDEPVKAAIHNVGNSGNELERGWGWTTVTATVEEGAIVIGFTGTAQVNGVWAGADDFKLYYGGAVKPGIDTGIENIATDAEIIIYDLSGRRVEKMTKGLYIVNGKKVLVK